MPHYSELIKTLNISSSTLQRKVRIDVFLPPDNTHRKSDPYRLLLLNDGQDWAKLRLPEVLSAYYYRKMPPLVVAAIYAGSRIQEYGIAAEADYQQRGSKAGAYSLFLTTELLPYLQRHYPIGRSTVYTAIAGCSLGGLSAFDVAWQFPELFGAVGVFSGSFWWRSKALNNDYTDNDRIIHRLIAQDIKREGLRFWLQTGTHDEIDDRNQNGIIDSIDDTLDLLAILQNKGYKIGKDLRYVQIDTGQHNQDTWAIALPDFLKWTFR